MIFQNIDWFGSYKSEIQTNLVVNLVQSVAYVWSLMDVIVKYKVYVYLFLIKFRFGQLIE